MKQADAILLHDVAIDIDATGNGVYREFQEEKYVIPYPLSTWINEKLQNEWGRSKNLSDEDYQICREYQPIGPGNVVAILAEVPAANLLEMEIHWANEKDSEQVDWKERITYCGSFSVKWHVDA